MSKKRWTVVGLIVAIGFASAVVPTSAQAQADQACWGQATQVFARMGLLGEHASQQDNPRLGLRNLARALYAMDPPLIEDDSMAALGAFVAAELGLEIDACMEDSRRAFWKSSCGCWAPTGPLRAASKPPKATVAIDGRCSPGGGVSERASKQSFRTHAGCPGCLSCSRTLLTIQVIPPLVDAVGWEYVFMVLALEPAFGVWSMWRLRRLPEALRLALGQR